MPSRRLLLERRATHPTWTGFKPGNLHLCQDIDTCRVLNFSSTSELWSFK